jgi:hypothetical protein
VLNLVTTKLLANPPYIETLINEEEDEDELTDNEEAAEEEVGAAADVTNNRRLEIDDTHRCFVRRWDVERSMP